YGKADFLALRAAQTSFSGVAALTGSDFTLTGGAEPLQFPGLTVSAEYFPVLGVAPLLGRFPDAGSDRPGQPRQVVVSHHFWSTQLHSDPQAVGRVLTLDQQPYTIAAVMPADFQPLGDADTELFAINQFATPQSRPPYFLRVFGRLKDGVSLQQAQAEAASIAAEVQRRFPDSTFNQARAVPLKDVVVGRSQTLLWTLFAAVGFVLLIAMVNVASLLLARGSARRQEMSVRAALGATRARLLRQMLTESVLLSLAGCALGLLLARAGIALLLRSAAAQLPRSGEITLDATAVAFTALLAVLAGTLFGLAPAWQSSRAVLFEDLKQRGGNASSQGGMRIHDVLIVTEFALALVLLVGAGLMIKSFARLQRVDSGVEPTHVLTARVSLPRSRYGTPQQIIAFYRDLLGRTSALPGVEAAAVTLSLPPNLNMIGNPFRLESQPLHPAGPQQEADEMTISPDYFHALGIPLLRGRFFTDADGQDKTPGVLIINQSMAKKYFPGQDPIGRRLQTGDPSPQSPWETVVGVVGDVKYEGLDEETGPTLYVPYNEGEWTLFSRTMFLVLRTSSDPASLTSALRAQVAALDKDLPLTNVRTMPERIDESVDRPRFRTLLLGSFAAAALLLAAIGIYGVLAYSVSQRTREIGIRMALGANPARVVALVVARGMVLVGVGVTVGLAGALALTRLMSSLLYAVSARDPQSFVAVSVLLAMVALLACYLPARIAARVDPMIALRSE
ncbi:MAG TPA: ABC transporter permease, partial [Terriglobales bacterium]|nr:ABC transporter permease [Terriglobales bacterium]